MKTLLTGCAILLLASLPASAADCGTARGRSFRVGVENLQYYPLHTVEAGNRYGGFAREVLDAFAQQHGYQFDYVALPINRLYTRFLGERTLDFKYPDNPKWRADLRRGVPLWYSDVVVSTEEGALVLPHRRGMTLAQLRTLGTVLGFTPWPVISMRCT